MKSNIRALVVRVFECYRFPAANMQLFIVLARWRSRREETMLMERKTTQFHAATCLKFPDNRRNFGLISSPNINKLWEAPRGRKDHIAKCVMCEQFPALQSPIIRRNSSRTMNDRIEWINVPVSNEELKTNAISINLSPWQWQSLQSTLSAKC